LSRYLSPSECLAHPLLSWRLRYKLDKGSLVGPILKVGRVESALTRLCLTFFFRYNLWEVNMVYRCSSGWGRQIGCQVEENKLTVTQSSHFCCYKHIRDLTTSSLTQTQYGVHIFLIFVSSSCIHVHAHKRILILLNETNHSPRLHKCTSHLHNCYKTEHDRVMKQEQGRDQQHNLG